jgi:hypothetical protein
LIVWRDIFFFSRLVKIRGICVCPKKQKTEPCKQLIFTPCIKKRLEGWWYMPRNETRK